jgi:hypothetical protein
MITSIHRKADAIFLELLFAKLGLIHVLLRTISRLFEDL